MRAKRGLEGRQLQRAHRVSTDFASNMRRQLVAKSRPMAVTNRCAAVSVVTVRAPRCRSAARARSAANRRARTIRDHERADEILVDDNQRDAAEHGQRQSGNDANLQTHLSY